MYKIYKTKTILNIHKHCDGGWFWDKYSAFPYIGCEYGCEYCYERDEKYNPRRPSRDLEVLKFSDPFSEYVKIKENAPELLRKELKDQPRDLIYLDSYQPVEAKHKYVRKMLMVCLELGFPVFINEKSPMVLRDLEILKKISQKSYLNVGWSIMAAQDDETLRVFEPKAPAVSARFQAMAELSRNGILTGTVFMPILPFIYDAEENIEAVVKKTRESGGQYVLDGGLTLSGYCRTHFYKAVKNYEPSLIPKYDNLYNNSGRLAEHTALIRKQVLEYCQKHKLHPSIPRPIDFYPKELQINKRVAEQFYLKARELQLSGKEGHKEWAYRRAAWTLDDLEESVASTYSKEGIKGLMKVKNIGERLAAQIEEYLKSAGI